MNAAEFSQLEALVGRVIADRYRVDGVLGIGGMGAVLRCHHLGLQRDVAVKVLHPDMSRQSEVSARFDREAQSASRLDHPNCVQVFDYGTWRAAADEPPIKFMAMQLLSGTELTALLGQPLPPARAVELVDQVLAALEHAHGQGVVHRDLKPQNVFVTRDHAGRELLKLVDFGIAKVVSGEGADARMTRVGFIFGTPRYMSPEQAAGGEVDERTDLYAAGIMLYEMLAGRAPFEADDITVLIRQQLSADPPPLPTSVSRPVADVVFRLLAKDRKDRYESAAAVRTALARALSAPATTPTGLGMASTLLPTGASTDTLNRLPLGSSYPAIHSTIPATPTSFPLIGRPERSGARLWFAAGGVALAMATTGWLFWPESEAPTPTPGPAHEEPILVDALRAMDLAPGRASADEIRNLDRALHDKRYAEAKKIAQPLLVKYPKDPQLLWRSGKILAKTEGDRPEALLRYEEALTGDKSLLDDETFWAELSALLREEALRAAAIDLAVRKLGERGHPFLLELVNRDMNIVSFAERHAMLEALEDGTLAVQVDRKLQRALDLWQAEQQPKPCTAFGEALEHIEEDPDPYYLGTLDRIKPPKPPEKTIDARCDSIASDLERVKSEYATRYRDYQGERVVPAAYRKQKKKRRTLRSILGL